MIKHGDDTALDFTDDMIQLNLLFQGQWQNNSSKWEDLKIPLAKKSLCLPDLACSSFLVFTVSGLAFVVDLAMDYLLFKKAQTILSSSDHRPSLAIETLHFFDIHTSDLKIPTWNEV